MKTQTTGRLGLLAASTIAALIGTSALIAQTQPDNVIVDPTVTLDPVLIPSFLFEPEINFDSLKEVAQWPELEQMLDNPYATRACPETGPGSDQGYAPRCTTIRRRHSFLPAGCTYDATLVSASMPRCNDALLPDFMVHPLNYNPTTGEEFRLLNPRFAGRANWLVPMGPPGTPAVNIGPISSGASRIEPGDEPVIDYNSPVGTAAVDMTKCITLEGQQLCGGDPGEPPNYSMPAVCGNNPISGWVETRAACTNNTGRLYDPTPLANGRPRGIIRSLAKPTVGSNFAINSLANLAGHEDELLPSNPSDYYNNREFAIALGKALFWDMQLGSDGVQSCGTCHFTAGIDTRTKNQLNPNHLGGDFDLEIFANRHPGSSLPTDQLTNQDVVASDFPLHKLANPMIPGEPMLNPGNVVTDTNDVMSSMGVLFDHFVDIPTPGTAAFSTANNGVRALLPDIGDNSPDPIPLFTGLRRVEPRNTPTMFNAAFNFDNFWDGRARHDFNGGSVFGAVDPQGHVWTNQNGLQQTRQVIRFASIASLFTGPALSEFEMSFLGRNWQKIGKKLLQGNGTALRPRVTPMANQLVSVSDSVLGRFSNQGGSWCVANGRPTATNRPGLCITYNQLIQNAYKPRLWNNTTQHVDGASAPCDPGAINGTITPLGCDPFDGYVLSLAAGAADPANTNQFTQMEANFPLFGGLAVQSWVETLVSDDTPFDRFMDANSMAFKALGEPGEPGLVADLPLCNQNGGVQPCLTEVGPFKRNPAAGEPDPLLGLDVFFASNLTLRNTDFRSARCGECHAGGTLTDHTIEISSQLSVNDFVPEFAVPGQELILEPLGQSRQISGFLLESEINGNAQDGIERNMIAQSLTPDPVDGLSYPEGASFFDNGVYNLGVRPIDEDVMRGGTDPWGWPLSLATLMLMNTGGIDQQPETPLANFDATMDCDQPQGPLQLCMEGLTGHLFEETGQDQHINPGMDDDLLDPKLPPHLYPWLNALNVGNAQPDFDEIFGGLNTLMETPILEGFVDVLGPFNPNGILNENMNNSVQSLMGTWPMVNRVARMGSVKAPQLRNIELSGPYFHNGGKLTLRQVVDFYARGGDFPVTNGHHRDFNILSLRQDIQSALTEADENALVDFLLTLTDERVAHEQGPFDRPEIFVPVDGRAPRNTGGRGLLLTLAAGPSADCGGTDTCFRQLAPVGTGGHPERLTAFLNISRTRVDGPNNDHYDR
jgi:cytochrome c peroxidase